MKDQNSPTDRLADLHRRSRRAGGAAKSIHSLLKRTSVLGAPGLFSIRVGVWNRHPEHPLHLCNRKLGSRKKAKTKFSGEKTQNKVE